MGSVKTNAEHQFRQMVAAECLRAGLALVAIGMLFSTSAGRFDPPRTWVVVLGSILSWGIATSATWLGKASPLKTWQDALAPAAISWSLASSRALPSVGLGYVCLGLVILQLTAILQSRTLPAHQQVPNNPEETARTPLMTTVVDTVASNHPAGEGASPPIAAEHHPQISRKTLPSEPVRQAAEAESVPACPQLHEADPAEPISESWTRKEYQGEVSIEAVVHARFEAGARVATIHLPFIPPLPVAPIIETEPLESGCDVDIQVESAWRHGARLQVSRPTAGEAAEVPVGVVIYTAADEEIEYSE